MKYFGIFVAVAIIIVGGYFLLKGDTSTLNIQEIIQKEEGGEYPLDYPPTDGTPGGPQITDITPSKGPIGTEFTITGSGFATEGNWIRILDLETPQGGFIGNFSSSDHKSIIFTIPDQTIGGCPSYAPCFAIYNPLPLWAGKYHVTVHLDLEVFSNSEKIEITGPSAPPPSEVTLPPEPEGVIISMTKDGYTPKNITIDAGTMVTFVNDSDEDLWPASNIHPTHGILPEFDSKGKVKPGESYSYTFDKVGLWPYHDHRFPSVNGTIIVE